MLSNYCALHAIGFSPLIFRFFWLVRFLEGIELSPFPVEGKGITFPTQVMVVAQATGKGDNPTSLASAWIC